MILTAGGAIIPSVSCIPYMKGGWLHWSAVSWLEPSARLSAALPVSLRCNQRDTYGAQVCDRSFIPCFISVFLSMIRSIRGLFLLTRFEHDTTRTRKYPRHRDSVNYNLRSKSPFDEYIHQWHLAVLFQMTNIFVNGTRWVKDMVLICEVQI